MNTRLIFQIPLILALSILAQDDTSLPAWRGGGGVSVGIRQFDLGKVRSDLGSRGWGQPSETFLSVGGGGRFLRGMWMFGGEGGAWIPAFGSAERGGDQVLIAGGWGMAWVGVDPMPLGSLHLVPSLGMGGGGLGMKITHPARDRFASLVDGPGEESSLEMAGLLVEPAFTVEWRKVLGGDPNGAGFVSVGLRAAYAWSPWATGWSNSSGEVKDAPKVDLGGPSLRLMVSFGGQRNGR